MNEGLDGMHSNHSETGVENVPTPLKPIESPVSNNEINEALSSALDPNLTGADLGPLYKAMNDNGTITDPKTGEEIPFSVAVANRRTSLENTQMETLVTTPEPSLDRIGETARKSAPLMSVLALMGALGMKSPDAHAMEQLPQETSTELSVDATEVATPSLSWEDIKMKAAEGAIDLIQVFDDISVTADGDIDRTNDELTKLFGAEIAENFVQEKLKSVVDKTPVLKRLEDTMQENFQMVSQGAEMLGVSSPMENIETKNVVSGFGSAIVGEVIDSYQSKLTNSLLQSFRDSIQYDPSRADLSYALDERNANNMPIQYDWKKGDYEIKFGTDLNNKFGVHFQGRF